MYRCRSARLFACVVFSSLLGSVRAQAQTDSDLQESLSKLLEAQVECWNRGDLAGFMETYWKSPDLTFSSGGRTTRGWQETLDRYRLRYGDRETMGSLRFSAIETTPLGDDAALVLGRWHLTTEAGSPQGNFSLVLRRFPDVGWKIIHDHSSLEVPAEESSSTEHAAGEVFDLVNEKSL